MRWISADLGENKKFVFDDMIQSLKALGHQCARLPRNDMDRRQDLLNAIMSGDFDGLLTWQRFYPMQNDLIDAVAESGIETVFMDYGFDPHYQTVVFDRKGENATSELRSLWNSKAEYVVDDVFLEMADNLISSKASKSSSMEMPENEKLSHLRAPFIFVPLQRPEDSVIKYDSVVHDFGHLLRRTLSLARGRLFVVCKTHPLDAEVDLGVPDVVPGSHVVLREGHGARNDVLCEYLLSRSALTIGINSNMLFRSLLYGTPTLATGEGWYSGSGALHEVRGVEGLKGVQYPPVSYEARRRYVAACLSRQLLFSELSDPNCLRRVFSEIGARLDKTRAPVL